MTEGGDRSGVTSDQAEGKQVEAPETVDKTDGADTPVSEAAEISESGDGQGDAQPLQDTASAETQSDLASAQADETADAKTAAQGTEDASALTEAGPTPPATEASADDTGRIGSETQMPEATTEDPTSAEAEQSDADAPAQDAGSDMLAETSLRDTSDSGISADAGGASEGVDTVVAASGVDEKPFGSDTASAQVTPGSSEATAASEPASSSSSAPPPLPPASEAPPPERKGGFIPLLLGGLVAGGIGYGVSFLTDDRANVDAELTILRGEIAGLRTELEAIPVADTEALEAELAQLREDLAQMPQPETVVEGDELAAAVELLREEFAQLEDVDLTPLEARFAEVQEALEAQQQTLDSAEETALANSEQVARFSEDISQVSEQMAHFEDRLAALDADMADLRDLAERRVTEAEAAIDGARAQSGLDSVRAAMETGAPYADAVARLQGAGVEVPEPLVASAETGIATVEELQEGFDAAARAGLRVALQDAPADSAADRLGNFFRAQVGARSTVPREGDDPDAVLSRAAAEVEAGEIEAALAEIANLSEDAQAAMGDWLSQAEARLAARNAIEDLTTAITTE